jgi:hypothetical protein
MRTSVVASEEPKPRRPKRGDMAAPATRVTQPRPRFAPFFLVMATVFIAVVAYGFGNTIPNRLIHPKIAPPLILWVHAMLFVGWIILFFTQSALVRTRNLRTHRRLGIAVLVVGSLIPIVGIATSIVMDHINIANKSMDNPQFVAIQISDLACFAVFFALAAILRRKPALHRRLMFVATCVLMAAAFARFPSIGAITNDTLFFIVIYAGADMLVACGILKDLIEEHTVSAVYRYALPFLVIAQCITVTLYSIAPSWLVTFARHITAS